MILRPAGMNVAALLAALDKLIIRVGTGSQPGCKKYQDEGRLEACSRFHDTG
jgi:hypothetical protein